MDSTTDFGSVGQGSNPCRGTYKALYAPFYLLDSFIDKDENPGSKWANYVSEFAKGMAYGKEYEQSLSGYL